MKKTNVIIGIVAVIIVIFIIVIKVNSNKEPNEIENTVENEIENIVVETKVEDTSKEVKVEGITFSNVVAEANEKTGENKLIFKAKNDTNQSIENKKIVCIFKDESGKVLGRRNIFIQYLAGNDEMDVEQEIEKELTNAKSFEFVEKSSN